MYDSDGEKIGAVEMIHYSRATSQPEWVGIDIGLLGKRRVLVPVSGATSYEDGLQVPFSKSYVEASPDVGEEEIDDSREEQLYSYYGIDRSRGAVTDSTSAGAGSGGYDVG